MNFRNEIYLGLLLMTVTGYGQTPIDKGIPYQPGQKIVMHFDYPQLIRVETWDRNEISIHGTVSINGGENDDAFELKTSTEGKNILIRNEIRNMKDLPKRITVVDGAKTVVFNSKAELQKYKDEHGKGSFPMTSWGVNTDIFLEIKVPRNADTQIESVYGMVEVRNFVGPLSVVATYGGVDAALEERGTGEITAETHYGEIYSNLDTKFFGDALHRDDFDNFVSAKPGTGPRYSLESKYGNVYIRKGR